MVCLALDASFFSFCGQRWPFTAFRGYQFPAHTSWWAHRQIHSHSQRRRLGLTPSVTMECLELAASSLQALVSSSSLFESRGVLPLPSPPNKCHCSDTQVFDRYSRYQPQVAEGLTEMFVQESVPKKLEKSQKP